MTMTTLTKTRSMILAVAVTLGFGLFSTPAMAVPVTTELSLVMDSSNSIAPADYVLQQQAYANVLAAVVPLDGSVVLSVVQFSTTAIEIIAPTRIQSAADLNSVINAITGAAHLQGWTELAGAIDLATSQLSAYDSGDNSALLRQIIDVSTDGIQCQQGLGNCPRPDLAAAASAAAIAAGMDQVNCLGIGGAADCSFIDGAGSFSVVAASFSDFEAALAQKIISEIQQDPIPEPGAAALFGLGLLIVGGAIRRRM